MKSIINYVKKNAKKVAGVAAVSFLVGGLIYLY
jgi:hypothetical protein